jgi:hypothetical protein
MFVTLMSHDCNHVLFIHYDIINLNVITTCHITLLSLDLNSWLQVKPLN